MAIAQVPDERLERVAETVAQLGAGAGDDLLPRHRRPGQGRLGGGGARQSVPRLDPRDRRDLPRRPLPRRLRRAPSRRPRRPARRHRDDRDRADPRRLRAGRAAPGPGSASRRSRATPRRSPSATGWRRCVEALARGPAGPLGPGARRRRPTAPRNLQALTTKPILYVANVDEGDAEAPEAVAAHAAAVGAGVVAVSARIEGELAELDPAEAEEMRESYGVEGSGLARLVRAAYDLLELITFFTAGEDKEAVARPLRRGADRAGRRRARSTPRSRKPSSKPRRSAGEQLVECGGYAAARDRGLLRIEGRDYVVAGRRRDHDLRSSGWRERARFPETSRRRPATTRASTSRHADPAAAAGSGFATPSTSAPGQSRRARSGSSSSIVRPRRRGPRRSRCRRATLRTDRLVDQDRLVGDRPGPRRWRGRHRCRLGVVGDRVRR